MTPGCPMEQTQQSPYHRLGPVKNEEILAYVLLEPDHYQKGRITNAAFSRTRLRDGTLSVCRASHSSKDEFERQVVTPQIEKHPGREVVGLLKATCASVRAILVEHPVSRAVCVVDDGLANYAAHAHLSYSALSSTEKYWDRNSKVTVRANLIEAFGRERLLQMDDVFAT